MKEKIIIRAEERCPECITDYTQLRDILGVVNRLIELYGEDANIDFDSGYNNIDESISFYRLETDKEYAKRIEKELKEESKKKIEKQKKENKDRAEYERLKRKFKEC